MSASRLFECTWPWLLSALTVMGWMGLGAHFPDPPDGLLGAAATVASVFASFLGVSKAIILTIKDTRAYKVLAKHGYIDYFYGYLREGILASIAFAALSIIGFFISKDCVIYGHHTFKLFEALWIFSGAASLFSYVRISNILFKLLKQV